MRPWLKGKRDLSSLDDLNRVDLDLIKSDDLDKDDPNRRDDVMIWLGVNHKLPFHEIALSENKILGFNESWELNRDYYKKAINIAYEYDGSSLDHEDRADILDQLKEPPNVSHPIYIITIESADVQRVVYVGKTSSDNSRFKSGHSAAIKLLDPIYKDYDKYIYVCQVMLYSEKLGSYLPLEFVGVRKTAEDILDDIESKLINNFKPVLNSQKTKSFVLVYDFTLNINNETDLVFSHSAL
ncbi:hypothetical protein [Hymenobacter cellulosivorans]|uniref:GIY-YIG nuclease family protein n=1 Tax=Hymenobacter cellulosivorans TaxID=2932249 RepID=A0ABY4F373_9BACT|nr:hypothetical protein [Hymenobacter cellulosivorans]UOQ51112.1 hypothetical protein MUN80_15230 [Hymenobacter cellulosivorans]